MRMAILIPLLFALSVFSLTATAATWVVDDDGGPDVDFLDIPVAISTASPGDRIIVRSGKYSSFVIDKSLKLIADTEALLKIDGSIEIINLGAGGSLVLSGFGSHTMLIQNCRGNVIVDDCRIKHITGFMDATLQEDPTRLTITNCKLVQVSRCRIPANFFSVYQGAEVVNSTVIFSECDLEGGRGSNGFPDEGLPALSGHNSMIFFLASSAKGGPGEDYYDPHHPTTGGDGGPAIFLSHCKLELFGRSTDVIRGGDAGDGLWGFGDCGNSILISPAGKVTYSGVTFISSGQPAIKGGESVEISPAVPVLRLDGSGELGTTIHPCLYGLPGSAYALYYSRSPAFLNTGFLHTQLLLNPRHLGLLEMGTIPTEGFISTDLGIPDLAQFQGNKAYFQAYVETPAGEPYLSTSAGFVVQ